MFNVRPNALFSWLGGKPLPDDVPGFRVAAAASVGATPDGATFSPVASGSRADSVPPSSFGGSGEGGMFSTQAAGYLQKAS
jgi:hypothetical protein